MRPIMPRPLQLVALLLAIGLGLLVRPSAQTPTAAIIQRVDTAVAKGPFAPELDVAGAFHGARLVRGRQVRHLHPLGRVLGAGLRQRVVSAQHVQAGHARVRASRGDLRTAVQVRLQGLHPAVQGRAVRPGAVGGLVQGGRRALRRAGGRAPRRLSDVRLLAAPTGAPRRWGPSATSSASWPKAVRAQGMVFGVSSHRAEHWWFFDRAARSSIRTCGIRNTPAFYGPAVDQQDVRARRQTARIRRTSTTGWRAPRAGGQVPAAARLVRLVDRAAGVPAVPAAASRRTTTTAAREWEQGRGHQLQEAEATSRTRPRVLDIERGQLGGMRRLFWQTDTSVSKNSWGYIEGQDYKTADPSSTTWSISSARTAACC